MQRPVDTVIDFLKLQRANGSSHVFIDDAARDSLRELYLRAHAKPQETLEPAAEEAAPKQSNSANSALVDQLVIKGETAAEKLASIRTQAVSWKPAKTLGTLRDIMVFATGDPEADIMLVGEAPGYQEEKQNEPFVGPAGQKLNDILKAMGLKREKVYISNLVKFRPSLPRQTTNNRKPNADEMAACLPLVRAEISIVQPKVIIALGGTSAEGLIGLSGTVGSMRGSWHEIDGIPARVTYHPSYLLQSGAGTDKKRALWEDMLAVMEKLGMPISEKQQGYFLPRG